MNTRRVRHLGISLGLIDSLDDGLGEFSTQLCERVAALAQAWERDGVRVHLHLPRRWHGRFGADVSYLGTSRMQGYWHWQGLQRFDVWHSLNQLGRIVPPWRSRHSLLTIHDLNHLYAATPRSSRHALRKLARRLRSFDEVTTLTRYVEGDIRTQLDWRGPVSIIPNGARDLTREPRQPVADLAPECFLLHLSRMAPSKNPQALLNLAAAWPEQQIVMAGPRGPDAAWVEASARERGLANLRVVQDVNEAQKAWLFANCRAFVFPSLTEGFGLPPIEAMHFGKPVFLSDRTSLPEVGGNAAAYFTSFDPLAMRSLIESELPRLAAQSAAIRAHAARFSWDTAVRAYIAIYDRLLGRG